MVIMVIKVKLSGDSVISDELLEEITNEMNNCLSNKYGYYVESYDWSIEFSNIIQDTSEQEKL